MTTTEVGTTRIAADVGERAQLGCTVCPHPWSAHDRIGIRFCTATAAATALSDRGCVCVPVANE